MSNQLFRSFIPGVMSMEKKGNTSMIRPAAIKTSPMAINIQAARTSVILISLKAKMAAITCNITDMNKIASSILRFRHAIKSRNIIYQKYVMIHIKQIAHHSNRFTEGEFFIINDYRIKEIFDRLLLPGYSEH